MLPAGVGAAGEVEAEIGNAVQVECGTGQFLSGCAQRAFGEADAQLACVGSGAGDGVADQARRGLASSVSSRTR